jgi:hypothetical protein
MMMRTTSVALESLEAALQRLQKIRRGLMEREAELREQCAALEAEIVRLRSANAEHATANDRESEG